MIMCAFDPLPASPFQGEELCSANFPLTLEGGGWEGVIP